MREAAEDSPQKMQRSVLAYHRRETSIGGFTNKPRHHVKGTLSRIWTVSWVLVYLHQRSHALIIHVVHISKADIPKAIRKICVQRRSFVNKPALPAFNVSSGNALSFQNFINLGGLEPTEQPFYCNVLQLLSPLSQFLNDLLPGAGVLAGRQCRNQ